MQKSRVVRRQYILLLFSLLSDREPLLRGVRKMYQQVSAVVRERTDLKLLFAGKTQERQRK